MNDIFLVIKGTPGKLSYSAYYNFKNMCEEESIDSNKIDRSKLPVRIDSLSGNSITILKVKVK